MDSFKKEALDTHNAYRKIHGAPALKWSNKLYQNAQRWADQLARRGSLQHESQNKEGENLACMQGWLHCKIYLTVSNALIKQTIYIPCGRLITLSSSETHIQREKTRKNVEQKFHRQVP